jgi:hypothetical protein
MEAPVMADVIAVRRHRDVRPDEIGREPRSRVSIGEDFRMFPLALDAS